MQVQTPRKYSSSAFCKKFHSMKRFTINSFALFWQLLTWIWVYVIVAILIGGPLGSAFYTYLTKGQFDPIDLPHLSIVQFVDTHLFLSCAIFVTLLSLIIASFIAHKSVVRVLSTPIRNEYTLQRVDQLAPNNYKLFRYLSNVYISREADITARRILHDLATNSSPSLSPFLGICIIGRPAQGKTRLTWDAMQAELPNWILIRWPHKCLHPFDFTAHQGQHLILWLDDLHEFANPNEAALLNDLPRRFLEAGIHLIVLATCRDGDDYIQTQKYLGSLLEQLQPIHLFDIGASEAADLTKDLSKAGIGVRSNEFDGTPGSLVLGIQRMQGRYLHLPPPAQQILKAMKLLRSAGIYTYPEARIRAVACDLFYFDDHNERAAYEILTQQDFIKLVSSLHTPRTLEPIADIYIEKVIVDYPSVHATMMDDWLALKECLQRHKDADALASLGLTSFDQFRENQNGLDQFAEKCYSSALEIYLHAHNYIDWAGTQNNLVLLFLEQADHIVGDQAIKLLDRGIEALNAALAVSSKESRPDVLVMIQHTLGVTLKTKANLVKGDEQLQLLDNSIQIFQAILNTRPQHVAENVTILSSLAAALTEKAALLEKGKQMEFIDVAINTFHLILEIYQRDRNPLEWAHAQSNLGVALSRKALLVSKKEERLTLLSGTAQAHRAALTVYLIKSTPLNWAQIQYNLGSTLSDEANLVEEEERSKLLKESINTYHTALKVFSKENTPKYWALVQYQLGDALDRQARLTDEKEQIQRLDEAIQAYRSALEAYDKTDGSTRWNWANIQNRIGKILYYKATLSKEEEQSNLLEQSIQAYHKVLEVYTQECSESIWINTQERLGISLHRRAKLVNGNEQLELLNKAIQAYNAALKGYNKTDISIQQALTQLNLSIALEALIPVTDRQGRQTLLDDGIKALRVALSIYTRENNPSNWAKAQHLLGTFLLRKEDLADTVSQVKKIEEATQAFQSALEVYTKDDTSTDWAKTQYDLGVAQLSLFELLNENIQPHLISRAIDACKSALEVYNPEFSPREWVQATIALAYADYLFSFFSSTKERQIALLRDAYHILESAQTLSMSDTMQQKDSFAMTLLLQIKENLEKIEIS